MLVAEGVEHPEQLVQLEQLGITVGQGFLLGRPGSLPGSERTTVETVERLPAAAATGAVAPSNASMSAWRQSIGLPVA
jgi:EAL domain-containing protein (putative c-di-GMP-specific phosphodiesterase class I)